MQSESRCVKIFGFTLDLFSLRNLVGVYFVINSIGMIIFSMLVATVLANINQPSIYVYSSLFEWARPPSGSIGKLASVLQYILPVMALFIYYAIYLQVSKFVVNLSETVDKNRRQKILFYLLLAIVNNCVLLFVGKDQKLILGVLSILWGVMFLWAPYSVFRVRTFKITLPKWFLSAALCVISIQYVAIFVPLITKPIQISNDYINISEKTLLETGRLIDNIGYINENKIAGLEIYDPRNPNPNSIPNSNPNLLPLDSIVTYGSAFFTKIKPPVLISNEIQDFIKLNSKELSNQTKAGWFLYHHGYNFGPMNALSLGASPDQQTMVYGWLSTVSQGKLLELFESSSYQGYFKLYFADYLAYFAIFIFGIWAIFKRLGTVLFAATLTVSALFFLGIEIVKLAPGFNPVRHIFDVPAFYLLYRYLVEDKKTYLILSCILAILAIFWSKDFGLFLALSIGGSVLFKGIKQRPFQLTPLFLGLITAVSGILLYFYPMPGANPTAMYMLLGVGAPIASSGNIFGLLIIISLLLAATIAIKQNEAYSILAVGFVLYFVQSLTYYIWYPKLHHILGVAPVFILWLVLIFNGWITQSEHAEKRQSTVLTLLLILVYLPASLSFYWGMHRYNQTFKNHQLYHWSFDKARFISTMEPTLFEESATLIKQHSTNNNGIFIISKYDHILPILAGKYSAMPYDELPTNLASPKEVEIASQAILKNKPAFLFVDTDINRSLKNEIPIESDPVTIDLKLFGEAVGRAMVLQGLKDVYVRVLGKYELCESGRLISVYCRKPD